MLKGNKIYAKRQLSWKKGFDCGVVFPERVRSCTNCKKASICSGCDKKINQIKEFEPNVNELKWQLLLHPFQGNERLVG